MDTTPQPDQSNEDSVVQSVLARTQPSNCFSLSQRLVSFVVRFPVEQTANVVAIGETFKVMEFVLKHPTMQIAADPDIERPRDAAHDVYAVVFAVLGHRLF